MQDGVGCRVAFGDGRFARQHTPANGCLHPGHRPKTRGGTGGKKQETMKAPPGNGNNEKSKGLRGCRHVLCHTVTHCAPGVSAGRILFESFPSRLIGLAGLNGDRKVLPLSSNEFPPLIPLSVFKFEGRIFTHFYITLCLLFFQDSWRVALLAGSSVAVVAMGIAENHRICFSLLISGRKYRYLCWISVFL